MKKTATQIISHVVYGSLANVVWVDDLVEEPKMKIVKLDGRHRGNPEYKYKIQFSNQKGSYLRFWKHIERFNEVRNWFHDTYKPSCEYEYILKLKQNSSLFNQKWCWDVQGENLKIFISDDEVLNWFSLRWMN